VPDGHHGNFDVVFLPQPVVNRLGGREGGRASSRQPYDGPERLPTPEDEATLQEIFKQPGWIAPGQA